jgi:hypothetical protein
MPLPEQTTSRTAPDEAAALLEELAAMPFDELAADFADRRAPRPGSRPAQRSSCLVAAVSVVA